MQALTDAKAIIRELGGPTRLAEKLGFKVQRVSNWGSFGRFPPNTFLAINCLLREKGFSAPAWMFGMEGAGARPAPSERERCA